MIVTTKFQSKTYIVQATQVRPDNIEELAEWCGGEYIESYEPDTFVQSGNYRTGQPCIEMVSGLGRRRVRAFIGDWVTKVDGRDIFKIYREKTFKEAFEEVLRDIPEEVMRRVVREEMRSLVKSMTATAKGLYNYADPGSLEEAGYKAIKKVFELEESMLPHAWNCELRNPAGYDKNGNDLQCNCEVGEDE
jgi:hypothetical protein